MNIHMVKTALNLSPIALSLGSIAPVIGAVPVLQAHSSMQFLPKSFAHHPKVRGRTYHQHLASVLGQALIVHLAAAELALDDQKTVLGLGANAGFELHLLFAQRTNRAALVKNLALARHHGDVPGHIRGCPGFGVRRAIVK